MPFDRRSNGRHDEDPELVAEREYEAASNGSGGSTKIKSAPRSDKAAALPGAKKGADSGRSSINDNGSPNPGDNVSTGDSGAALSNGVHFKEAKAARKKRCRGVSGSSIKKDGGRFDFGMDNLDDFDDISDVEEMDDMARYVSARLDRSNGDLSSESDFSGDAPPRGDSPIPPEAQRVKDVIVEAIRIATESEAVHIIADVLCELYNERSRLKAIERALDDLTEKDDWTTSGAVDRMAEYKTVSVLARVAYEDLISRDALKDFIEKADVDSQAMRILASTDRFLVTNAPELKGDLLPEPPADFEELAKEAVRCGEASLVAEAIKSCPFFHADFVHRMCTNAVTSMEMNILRCGANVLRDLVTNKCMTQAAVNAGVTRFIGDIRDLEMDLPAATSLAFLFLSYCVQSPGCIDYTVFRKCPRPRRFLGRRSRSTGRLSIRESTDNEEVTEENYLRLDDDVIDN